jgi:CO dehydrogenase/acetyl-CoA synthase beta subunit
MIKRYEVFGEFDENYNVVTRVYEDEVGEWVKYEDHKKALQELALNELSALGQAEEVYAREQQLVKEMVEAWRSVRDTASRPHLVKLAEEMLVKLGETL